MIQTILNKLLSVVCVSLLVSSTVLYFKVDRLESDNKVLTTNNVLLENTVKNQKYELDRLISDKVLLNNNILTLTSNNDKLNEQLSIQMNEINQLRLEENKRALENPFNAGNIATESINNRLSAITRKN